MNAPKISNRQLIHIASTYWQWRWLWVSTTAGFAILGLVYVLFLKGDTWVASQGLIIRDEANGAVMRLGRFESQTEMKAAQETVLEMARNSQVLSEALAKVGREPGAFSFFGPKEGPPTSAEIEALAKDGVEVRAPRGAELGTTEVIYLDIKQSSRERAVELNKAVCDALEKRLKFVRQARASGVITELTAAKVAATKNLKESTELLRRIEAEAGVDLTDLRGLTDTIAGSSTTRTALDTIKRELRQTELEIQQVKADLATAKATQANPENLLLTPTKLVNSQAGLRRIREGLAAAAIDTSAMRGKYTDRHPLVLVAMETEAKLRGELRKELNLAVETLTKELEVLNGKTAKLNDQRQVLEDRIAKLSQVRAGYANVVSEVQARNQQLQDTERELAQAEASRDASMTSSLITRIDEPLLGENPIGPGRSTILAGATFSGLFFGFGVVFLLTPLDGGANFGRRKVDNQNLVGRRASDAVAVPAAQASPQTRANSQTPSRAPSASPQGVANTPKQSPTGAPAVDLETIQERLNAARAQAGVDPAGNTAGAKGSPQAAETETPNLLDNRSRTITEIIEESRRGAPQKPGASEDGLPAETQSGDRPSLPISALTAEQTGAASNHSPGAANQTDLSDQDPHSVQAAQAVIAAALQCSFSEEANASPKSNA